MKIGLDEYSYFLNTHQNNFSKKEIQLIQQHFDNQKKRLYYTINTDKNTLD